MSGPAAPAARRRPVSPPARVAARRASAATAADTLVVEASPSTLAHGAAAAISARARTADGCDVRPAALSDSARFTVAAFSGPYGSLEYDGRRARVFSDVFYGDLKAGRVRFVADGEIPCGSDTTAVVVDGIGLLGAVPIVITGTQGAGFQSANATCTPRSGLVETKESILQWYRENCPTLADATDQDIEDRYERSLARYLFGGMGWGKAPEYLRSLQDGLDGYLRWYVDTDGHRFPQVGALMESKLTNNRPVNTGGGLAQALDHIDFLADQRAAFWSDFRAMHPNGAPFMLGDPLLIYVSQNQGSGDYGWNVGNRAITYPDGSTSPDYNQAILDRAAERNVQVVHAKVVNAFGYRTLLLRYLTPVRLLDGRDPLLNWLSEHFALDLDDWTFSTLWRLSLECELGPGDQESPPPPGWGN